MTDANVKQIKLGVEALQIVAKSLYTMPWLAIWVREIAIQNTVDAAAKDIKLTIQRTGAEKIAVEVTDDGVGMTEDVLDNAFLWIGKTGKTSLESAGGFGIASATVLSTPWWTIQTNTAAGVGEGIRICSEDMALMPIAHPRGTTVSCVGGKGVADTWYWLEYAIRMLYLSSLPQGTKLHAVVRDGEKVLLDGLAGIPNTCKLIKLPTECNDSLGLTVSLLEGNPFPKYYSSYCNGINIIRINGLVQYTTHSYNNRAVNLIFDVSPKVRPGEEGYPFSLSRESVTGDMREEINRIVNKFEVDQITSVATAVRDAPKKAVYGGKLLYGRRRTKPLQLRDMPQSEQEKLIAKLMESGSLGSTRYAIRINFDGMDAGKQADLLTNAGIRITLHSTASPTGEPAAYYEQYAGRSRANIHKDYRLLKAWKEVLLTVRTQEAGGFGIGLTLDTMCVAKRIEEGGITYYLLNPDKITQDTKQGKVLSMWQSATHEIAHDDKDIHDEKFSAEWSQLMRDTADIIYEYMKVIMREI
jgi:hypothetical protein